MSATTPKVSAFSDLIEEQYVQKKQNLYGSATVREQAAAAFQTLGIPTRRTEDYKYIAPDALLKKGFGVHTETSREITRLDIEHLRITKDVICLVIVNGVFSATLSDTHFPQGLHIERLAESTQAGAWGTLANADEDAFVAMNTMLCADGLRISFAPKTIFAQPIQLIYIACNAVASIIQPRLLIQAGAGAQAMIVETFESIGPVKTFTNAVTEVFVEAEAKIEHIRIQDEGESGHLTHALHGQVDAQAVYTTHTYTISGAWVRNNLQVVMAQPTAEAHLYGLYLPHGNEVVDNHTLVDHRVPNCMSNELYKGVIDGKSTAVFNGKIFVRKDAQKTNAYQTNRNILLSNDANVNTKPQLEIYADDVKCSHGTSTGRINEEALFYLQARGIGEESGRKLLMRAFAEEVVNMIDNESIRMYLDQLLDKKLN